MSAGQISNSELEWSAPLSTKFVGPPQKFERVEMEKTEFSFHM